MKTGTGVRPLRGVQPKEAIAFLKRKKIVETERWDDLQWGEHSHAFTVAHSAWHNMVLPASDPAWGSITPPND